MKSKPKLSNSQGAGEAPSELPQIRLQEQFIKQVKDDSLQADQVLTDRNGSRQKEERAPDDTAPLFIP